MLEVECIDDVREKVKEDLNVRGFKAVIAYKTLGIPQMVIMGDPCNNEFIDTYRGKSPNGVVYSMYDEDSYNNIIDEVINDNIKELIVGTKKL